MAYPRNQLVASASEPPVMETRRWLAELPQDRGVPLLNLSQAAPTAMPPKPLLKALSDAMTADAEAHVYGPVLGLPELRREVAEQWSKAYGGEISADQVAITSGCNQAFAAAVMSLARAGDAILVTTPWYFSHKLWLDVCGVEARLLDPGDGLVPSADAAAKLLSDDVKAISLITPNNPCGVEYPSATLQEFYELAKDRGIPLIVDETYRDFDSRSGAPHDLFQEADWPGTLIHLYSFSKAYRLSGHRVGAVVADAGLLPLLEKCLDAVTICPNQLGQRAALFGMRHLASWREGERSRILERRRAMEAGFARLNSWRLLGCGAYFAYAEHPFALDSETVAKNLLSKQRILSIPGTMCGPTVREGGSGGTERQIRFAYPNVDLEGIEEFFRRMANFDS